MPPIVEKKEFKRIVALLEKRKDRGTCSIYVSKSVFEAFKKKCGDKLSPSAVLEQFMVEFTEAAAKDSFR